MHIEKSTYLRASLLAVLIAAVAACSQGGSGKHASQVVAKVNDNEVTVSQLNRLLREAGADPGQSASVRYALDSLVDQDLLVQEAIKNKIDRDPDVVQALESSRRQILADAYAERMVYAQTPVDPAEEKTYYEQNPNLFAKRRIYQMDIFNVESKHVDAALKNELDKARNTDEVKQILNKHNIDFTQQSAVRAAEQIPLEMLGEFANATAGDIIIIAPDSTHSALMQIAQSVEKPLTLEQAKPYIHQYLISSRNRIAMQERVKDLRGKAKIVYQGSFADAVAAAGSEDPAAKKAAEDGTGADSGNGQYLEKGLSGIK
jgi:peptidyl-prolyl cis-trans isomerase C